jgi:nucleotide-binding universal stress UspA family protein
MQILIATGGSPHSERAVRLGGALAAQLGAELLILTVVAVDGKRPEGEKVRARALAALPAAQAARARTQVQVGDPAEEIVAAAEREGVDLIVVGEHEDHGLVARILSPTSERVIGRAPCPVLVATGLSDAFRRILICDSGTEDDALLDRFAARLPALLTADTDVTVLHVMSQISAAPGIRGWQLRADAEALMEAHTPEGEWLEHDMEVLDELAAEHHAKIRHGRVVDEILAESEEGYDLVVIGAHDTTGWRRLLLEDIAHQIIANIRRPLLVVPVRLQADAR